MNLLDQLFDDMKKNGVKWKFWSCKDAECKDAAVKWRGNVATCQRCEATNATRQGVAVMAKESGLPARPNIGEAIKKARLERGISLRELQSRLGCKHSWISAVELNEAFNLDVWEFAVIARAIGLKGSELLALAEEEANADS